MIHMPMDKIWVKIWVHCGHQFSTHIFFTGYFGFQNISHEYGCCDNFAPGTAIMADCIGTSVNSPADIIMMSFTTFCYRLLAELCNSPCFSLSG